METESHPGKTLVNTEIQYCENCDKDARDGVVFYNANLHSSFQEFGGDANGLHGDGYTCSNCGITDMHEPPRRSVQMLVDTARLAKQTPKPGFKGTYRRRAHINERLSSAHLVDPIICSEDLSAIQEQFDREIERNWIFRLQFEARRITKRDVQTVLRRLDKRHKGRRNFCVKYLEKWKTLKAHFEGKAALKYSYEQTGAVGAMFVKISNAWDRLQPPWDKEKRESWKFPERRHIINFNFIFRRIHTLLGPEYKKFDKEYPIPRNEKAIARLWVWWRAICKEADLPEDEEDVGQGFQPQGEKTKQITIDKWLKSKT